MLYVQQKKQVNFQSVGHHLDFFLYPQTISLVPTRFPAYLAFLVCCHLFLYGVCQTGF